MQNELQNGIANGTLSAESWINICSAIAQPAVYALAFPNIPNKEDRKKLELTAWVNLGELLASMNHRLELWLRMMQKTDFKPFMASSIFQDFGALFNSVPNPAKRHWWIGPRGYAIDSEHIPPISNPHDYYVPDSWARKINHLIVFEQTVRVEVGLEPGNPGACAPEKGDEIYQFIAVNREGKKSIISLNGCSGIVSAEAPTLIYLPSNI